MPFPFTFTQSGSLSPSHRVPWSSQGWPWLPILLVECTCSRLHWAIAPWSIPPCLHPGYCRHRSHPDRHYHPTSAADGNVGHWASWVPISVAPLPWAAASCWRCPTQVLPYVYRPLARQSSSSGCCRGCRCNNTSPLLSFHPNYRISTPIAAEDPGYPRQQLCRTPLRHDMSPFKLWGRATVG